MKFGSGVTRNVWIFRTFVIKFATFRSHNLFLAGCYANHSERLFCKQWCNVPEDADYENLYLLVAPALWCSWFGLIQVMARAEVLTEPFTDNEKRRMKKKFYAVNSNDIKAPNFGYYKGRLVCIDYS